MRFAVRQLKMVGDFWLHLIHVKFLLCARCCVKLFFFASFLRQTLSVGTFFFFLAALVLQVAASGLSLVATSWGYSSLHKLLIAVSSLVAEHRLSCLVSCGI